MRPPLQRFAHYDRIVPGTHHVAWHRDGENGGGGGGGPVVYSYFIEPTCGKVESCETLCFTEEDTPR
jgi:hypothetical protein